MPTAECLHAMQGHTAAVNAVAVTADGCKTISAASDATVKVWNTNQSSRYRAIDSLSSNHTLMLCYLTLLTRTTSRNLVIIYTTLCAVLLDSLSTLCVATRSLC